jgi:DNA repair protein RecO (recombination protein O)
LRRCVLRQAQDEGTHNAAATRYTPPMQWTDSGVILGTRRHGETGVILELMTAGHGRHLGMVRGGRSKRNSAVLQTGNTVSVTWTARLEEQLGQYSVEADVLRAGDLIGSGAALYALGYVASLLRLLPERYPQEGLHAALIVILEHLPRPQVAAPLVIRFEVALLAALGFGLDLRQCAATGAKDDLIYVSPKSGRAVSRAAGAPYHDKLLPLPGFVAGRAGDNLGPEAVRDGFRLTEFFLGQHLFEPRGLVIPDQRAAFVEAVMREFGEGN